MKLKDLYIKIKVYPNIAGITPITRGNGQIQIQIYYITFNMIKIILREALFTPKSRGISRTQDANSISYLNKD